MEALLEKEGDVENWNDDRLDELSRRMDEGRKEMREGFAQTVSREEMKELIATINTRSERIEGEMKEGFEKAATRESVAEVNSKLGRFEARVDERMDRLYWGFVLLALALVGNSVAQGVWG